MTKIEQLIQALHSHGYTLELRSPGYFGEGQYSACFWHETRPICPECKNYPGDPVWDYAHEDTLEEAIREDAQNTIDYAKLDINIKDYE